MIESREQPGFLYLRKCGVWNLIESSTIVANHVYSKNVYSSIYNMDRNNAYQAEIRKLNGYYKEDLLEALQRYDMQRASHDIPLYLGDQSHNPVPIALRNPLYQRHIAELQDIHRHYKEARAKLNEKYSNYEHWLKVEAERNKEISNLVGELFKDVQFE